MPLSKALVVALAAALGAVRAVTPLVAADQETMVPAEIQGEERFAELRSNVALPGALTPLSSEASSLLVGRPSEASEESSSLVVAAVAPSDVRLPVTDVIGEAPHTTLSSDEVDQVARYVLLGARSARCAGKGEYCDLILKSCKDEDCAASSEESSESSKHKKEHSEESSEESSESSKHKKEHSEESSEESSESSKHKKEHSEESAHKKKEHSEESSEESSRLAELSAAEKAALAALSK